MAGVVPENVIQAELNTSSGELTGRSSPTMASAGGTLFVLACRSLDLSWWRELRPRMADANIQFQELTPFDLSIRDAIGGKLVSLADLRGQVVVVDFRATWCVQCVAELPRLKRWYTENRDKGLQVIGWTLDEDEAVLRAFVAKQNIPWPQHFQGTGWPWSCKWGGDEIAVLFVIDRRGHLRYVERAGVEVSEERIPGLLEEPPS